MRVADARLGPAGEEWSVGILLRVFLFGWGQTQEGLGLLQMSQLEGVEGIRCLEVLWRPGGRC
jgi:hypothetical protein